jgi:hypothetical protein
LFPILRESNEYPHLIEVPVTGNPERMGIEEVGRRAVELLQPLRRKPFESDVERYEDAVGSRRTTERLSAVLGDAHRGMVEALFVAERGSIWGRFDPTNETFALTSEEDPIGCDLYDLAAFQTLSHGGRVHLVPAADVPHGGAVAALLRYGPPAWGPTVAHAHG